MILVDQGGSYDINKTEFIKHSGIAAGALVVTSAARYPHGQKRRVAKSSPRAVGEDERRSEGWQDCFFDRRVGENIPNSLQSTAADQVHTTARIRIRW